MLEHRFAFVVLAHLEDIEVIVFAICTPVVLRGLERSIHLVEPSADQSRVLGSSSNYTAASVETGSEGTIVRCEICCVSCQNRQRNPALAGNQIIHGDLCNVCNVPGEADAVTSGLTLGNICGPVLSECFNVDQAFCIELVEPFETFLEAFLCCTADNLAFVSYNDVSARIRIA